jgi:glycosyltransferase involved in cell wall biosynthesis
LARYYRGVPSGVTWPQVAFDVTPLQNMHRFRGIGRYVRGLAQALLAQQEIPIEFWGWHDDRPFDVPPPHRGLWLRRFGLPRTRWSWFLGPLGMRLRRRLSTVSIVHLTDPRAFVPLRGATLTTVYDLIPLLDPQTRHSMRDWPAYQRYVSRLSSAAGIFAISRQTADDLREQLHFPPPEVHVVPPGVEIPPDDPVVPANGPYFLYVGSADRHKNLEVLVEAFARADALPERLVLVGPWHQPNVAMLAEMLDQHPGLAARVSFEGFKPDAELRRLIRGATAVVLPSRWEGFGLPAAEALAAGGVVIHSKIAVLTEVSGDAALTFDPASSEELAGALQRVSREPGLRARLRELGLNRARSLTWTPALETTLRVYQRHLRA